MTWKSLFSKSYNWSLVLSPGFRHSRSICTTSKCCGWYQDFYLVPVTEMKKQKELAESGELAEMAHLPVRPAHTWKVQSCWYDYKVSKFVNLTMREGSRIAARRCIEQAFENLKRMQLKKYYEEPDEQARAKIVLNPWEIFYQALDNCVPSLETMRIKKGGSTYHVPIPIKRAKGEWLAMRWIIEVCKEKEMTLPFATKLTWELLDAFNNTGRVVKRKQDLHKLCEANRAYAHFRWN